MVALRGVRDLLQRPILRIIALSSMLATIVTISLDSRVAVLDPDNWWHLKIGEWILQNHAFPHFGLFSRTAATKPWIAYSWGYEILISRSYDSFGLIGVASYGLVMTLMVAVAFFWMAFRLSRSFWIAWMLCAVGCYAFLFELYPRPVFFSMALFSIVLMLILEAHREGKLKLLYPLPLIFVFWASLHIQFVYGLFAIGLYFAAACAHRVATHLGIQSDLFVKSPLPLNQLGALVLGCAVGTCVGPYGYHLFEVIFRYSVSQLPYTFIQELQSPEFRKPTDYVLLMLMSGGYFVLGWQQKIDVFKILLIATASAFAFRTSRDVWFLGICAAAFIADFVARTPSNPVEVRPLLQLTLWEIASSGALVTLLTISIASHMGLTTRSLDRKISATFPVDAANYVRKHPVPGLLYNDFNWGGFLIWYMPDHPVSIDGRTDLYGDEATATALQSWAGNYNSDRSLDEAGVVILSKAMPLPWKLASDPRFRIAYQDQIAVVFVRNN